MKEEEEKNNNKRAGADTHMAECGYDNLVRENPKRKPCFSQVGSTCWLVGFKRKGTLLFLKNQEEGKEIYKTKKNRE